MKQLPLLLRFTRERMKEVDKVNDQNYYVETVLRQRVNW